MSNKAGNDDRLDVALVGDALVWTLTNPTRMNALSRRMITALSEAIAAFSSRRGPRAVIITGAGDRAFCAGADLKERATMPQHEVGPFVDGLRQLMSSVAALPVPVIAAINGVALGGGLELALACDFRIAEEHARVGLPEVRLGIIPGAGGTQRLPRLIGPTKAKHLILSGATITAQEGHGYGVLCEVVPIGKSLERALELAREFSAGAPLAVASAKRAIDQGLDLPLDDAWSIERDAYHAVVDTHDRVEALNAFNEKRPPIFRGE